MDGRRSCLGASGCGNNLVVLHMEALKGVMKMNLLIENYDDECGLDYYYIQNNEINEFGDEIFKKLDEIAVELLIYRYFVCNCAKIEKERKKAISKISDYLESVGYPIEKIFIMSNGSLENIYTIK